MNESIASIFRYSKLPSKRSMGRMKVVNWQNHSLLPRKQSINWLQPSLIRRMSILRTLEDFPNIYASKSATNSCSHSWPSRLSVLKSELPQAKLELKCTKVNWFERRKRKFWPWRTSVMWIRLRITRWQWIVWPRPSWLHPHLTITPSSTRAL